MPTETPMPIVSTTQEPTTHEPTTSSQSTSTKRMTTTPVCGENMIFGRMSNISNIPLDSIYSIDETSGSKLIIGNQILGRESSGWSPSSAYNSIYVELNESSFVRFYLLNSKFKYKN